MKNCFSGAGRVGRAVLSVALLCAASTVARAQVVYSTNFDSTDTVNGRPATGFTAYSSPNQPVDNLDGQNNWASTDPLPVTGNAGTANQIYGGSDYVGTYGSFLNNFVGAIGGNQRNATPDYLGA